MRASPAPGPDSAAWRGLPWPAASSPARSVPDHPISQLLKKLQCAVYRALYPIVSRGAGATASAPGCCSLPPDADGLLAPGSRRLRPSQSLYCMPSPAEPSPVPPPPEGPSDSAPHRGVDSSPAGPPSPLADTSPHLPGKDSSFEDLEQFLATSERRGLGPGGRPEPQTPGGRKEPLLEQLKGVVQDIHDAIGEVRSTGHVGSVGAAARESWSQAGVGRGRDQPGPYQSSVGEGSAVRASGHQVVLADSGQTRVIAKSKCSRVARGSCFLPGGQRVPSGPGGGGLHPSRGVRPAGFLRMRREAQQPGACARQALGESPRPRGWGRGPLAPGHQISRPHLCFSSSSGFPQFGVKTLFRKKLSSAFPPRLVSSAPWRGGV